MTYNREKVIIPMTTLSLLPGSWDELQAPQYHMRCTSGIA